MIDVSVAMTLDTRLKTDRFIEVRQNEDVKKKNV